MGLRGPKPGQGRKPPGTGRDWPKGVSGNPGGFTKAQHAVRRLISEEHGRRMQEIVPDAEWARLVEFFPGLPKRCTFAYAMTYGQAVVGIKGSTAASSEITDRLEGKVKQQIDVRNVSAYDDDTLNAKIAELEARDREGKPN